MAKNNTKGSFDKLYNSIQKSVEKTVTNAILDGTESANNNTQVKVNPNKIVIDKINITDLIELDDSGLSKKIENLLSKSLETASTSVEKQLVSALQIAVERGMYSAKEAEEKGLNEFIVSYKDFAKKSQKQIQGYYSQLNTDNTITPTLDAKTFKQESKEIKKEASSVADEINKVNKQSSRSTKIRIFDGTKEEIYDTVKDYDLIIAKMQEVADKMKSPVFHTGNISRNTLKNKNYVSADNLGVIWDSPYPGDAKSIGNGVFVSTDAKAVKERHTYVDDKKHTSNQHLYALDLGDYEQQMYSFISDDTYEMYQGIIQDISNDIMNGLGKEKSYSKNAKEIYIDYIEFFKIIDVSLDELDAWIKAATLYVKDALQNKSEIYKRDNLGKLFATHFMGAKNGLNATRTFNNDSDAGGSVIFDINKKQPYSIDFGNNTDFYDIFTKMVSQKILSQKASYRSNNTYFKNTTAEEKLDDLLNQYQVSADEFEEGFLQDLKRKYEYFSQINERDLNAHLFDNASGTTFIDKQTEALKEEQLQAEGTAEALDKIDKEQADDSINQVTQESAKLTSEEAQAMVDLYDKAIKAADAKKEFADANGEVLSSIVESLKGLNSEGDGFESLNKLINKLSNVDKTEKLVESLKAIQKVLNESVSENSMINAIKDLASQGENLEAVATVLRATKTQVENAKKAVSVESNAKANTSVEEARERALKEYINLLNRKNRLEAQNISKSKSGGNIDREEEIARITEEIGKLNILNLTEEENARVTRETANSRVALTDAQNKANENSSKQDEANTKALEKYRDSIQDSINSLDLLEAKRKYTSTFSSEISDLKSELLSLQTNSEGIDIVSEDEINQLNRVISKVKELSKQATIAENKAANENSIQKNLGKINDVLSSNTKQAFRATDVYKDYVRLQELFKNFDASKPQSELNELVTELLSVDARFKELDDTVKGGGFLTQFAHRLSDMNAKFFAQYFSFQDIIRYARQAITNVTQLNDAFIELSKVSNTALENLEADFQSYATTAKDIGGTVTDTINATADWARMGYGIPDSKELARVALLYKNVGDGIDITSANQSLISTLQGYQMQADEAEHIVDVFNEVANNYAIDTAGIGEALQRSAASLNAANTSLEQSVALVTAANTVVQNPESVGTTFKTLSARIRGATTELADLGEEEDEFTQTTSKLQNLVKSLTGFDILESDQKTFKDIYTILVGIGEKWQELDDIERASLGEALAGKRNANTLYAVLDNINTLKDAYETAENSAGKQNCLNI